MEETSGTVSIIMPSYNTASFIAMSIESVLKQTYSDWELIIVDDFSDDLTDEVVSKYLADKRISYYKNSENKGAAYSRNLALKTAKGRWIAFLDSDDLWEPDKLEKQLEFMLTNGYSFSYTQYDEINENGQPLYRKVSGPKKISKNAQIAFCWQGCLTVMYDRSVVGDIQIKEIKKNNDYAMWLKVCKKCPCYLLNKNLSHYRKRKGSISRHGYITLIKWHYYMWRQVEEKSVFLSLFFTFLNLIFGVYKKITYINPIKNQEKQYEL